MTCELAKKLYIAGFERKDVPFSIGKTVLNRELTKEEKINTIILVDLSELVEACGEKFWSLGRTHDDKWFACGGDMDESESTAHVSSPTEAVANLWLELNKKYDINKRTKVK